MPEDASNLPNENTTFRQRPIARSEDVSETSLLSVSRRTGLCAFPKRYILAIMLSLGNCVVMIIRAGMSVAVVAMTKNKTVIITGPNGTTTTTVSEFEWSSEMQGLLLGAFYWGAAVIQIPAGILSNRFGGKITYFCGILGLGVFTIITPPSAKLGGLPVLIVVKILEGVLEGLTGGSMQTLCSKWAPPMERTRLTTIAFSGLFLGTMFGMLISGVIADSIGWQWIFYIYGMCAVLYCICWYWLISESPNDHRTITSEELEYITDSIGIHHKDSTPWKSILTSLPFWAFAVSYFVNFWSYYTLILQLPSFLSDILRTSLDKVGYLSAIPFPVTLIAILVGGQLADLMRSRAWLSTTSVRKLDAGAGFVGHVVILVVACQLMNVSGPWTMVCLTLSAGFSGVVFSSLVVNPQDIAPQFADIMWTIANTGGYISSFCSSAVAGALTSNKTPEEWKHVFYLCACLSIVGCIVSCFFTSGSLQPWAQSSAASADETNDHTTDNDHGTSCYKGAETTSE